MTPKAAVKFDLKSHRIYDISDKMKREFFQVVAPLVLMYGCTPWTLTKRLEKRLDGKCVRILRTVLYPEGDTIQKLYCH